MHTTRPLHFLYAFICVVLLTIADSALAAPIDVRQETVVTNSTRAEAKVGGSQSASSRVTTETNNGSTTVRVQTVINGEVREYTASTTTTPVSIRARVEAGTGSESSPDVATVHVNDESLHEVAEPVTPIHIPSPSGVPSVFIPAVSVPTTMSGDSFPWWDRVHSQLVTFVFPYLISLWNHS